MYISVSNIYNYNGLLSLNDQLTIANSGGAAIFSSTITATGATIASDVVGDPVYLRVRNNNTNIFWWNNCNFFFIF